MEEVGDSQTLNLVCAEPQTEHPKVEVGRTYVGLVPEALCSEPDSVLLPFWGLG